MLRFFCHHQYAHDAAQGRCYISATFKGVDLAVFSIFHSMGVKTDVHSILSYWDSNGWRPEHSYLRCSWDELDAFRIECLRSAQ